MFSSLSVAESLLERKVIEIHGSVMKISLLPNAFDKVDSDSDHDKDSRKMFCTIIVNDLEPIMAETMVLYLENKNKHGGPLESDVYCEGDRTLTVRFADRSGE